MTPIFSAGALALALLAGAAPAAFAQTAAPSTEQPRLGAWGYDLAGRDPAVKPGDNFFLYANGNYLKTLVIPPTGRASDRSTSFLNSPRAACATCWSRPRAAPPQSHDAQIIGAAYKAYMDEPRLEALDAKPLAPDLAAIRAADTREKLAALMGRQNDGYFDCRSSAWASAPTPRTRTATPSNSARPASACRTATTT